MDAKTFNLLNGKRGNTMGKYGIRIFETGLIFLLGLPLALGIGPRVVRAQEEHQIAILVDQLAKVRSHIALYQAEHDGLMPGQFSYGEDVTAEAFIKAIEESGSEPFPANPFMSEAMAKTICCVNGINAKPSGNEAAAWWFNAATGHFTACDSHYHAQY